MTYEEMSAENDRKQLIRDERRKDHKWYYQKNKEKYKERSLAYYYAHREDRIKKVRDRYNAMSPEAKKERLGFVRVVYI